MKTAIVNVGDIYTGSLANPTVSAEAILMDDGVIVAVGTASAEWLAAADIVIDAARTTAVPGLIDSHVHITFGDFTPRQNTVGYLESYTHGGVTACVSASEVHVPGRPRDPVGVVALAIAARKCFETYRPGGMTVHAGTVIIEPGLSDADFAQLASAGVRYAKVGFGAFETPFDYAPYVAMARRHGMITMAHTGGSSIPGSSGIWAEHILAISPDVSFHVNGGPTAMPETGFRKLVEESEVAMQVCTAGNLRTTLLVAKLLADAGQLDRLLIATDTPTGSGVMPLGMLYTITHLCSLAGIGPGVAIAAATGNNARAFGLASGELAVGKPGDIVLLDAAAGGSQDNATAAILNGDIPAVSAVFTSGVPRFVGRSRNTPAGQRSVAAVAGPLKILFAASSAH